MPVNINSVDNLSAQLEYMYGLGPSTIKLGLERTEALLASIGNPHDTFPSVHITGTNGKGSTAAMLESILRHAGLKTGLYTSPHIDTFNERVRINNQNISDQQLLELIAKLRHATESYNIDPTFHEFTTALAFAHFAQEKVDLAVVEVCMGGQLDTTNVITPLISVITNVGIDHTKWLGPTKQHIAREKAGIIKDNVPLVTSEKDPGLRTYFESVCRTHNAPYAYTSDTVAVTTLKETSSGQTIRVTGAIQGTFELGLPGQHQCENTAAVLQTVLSLRQQGIDIPDTAIAKGLAAANWPGRLDAGSTKPFVLIDAGNNADSIDALRKFIDAHMLQRDVLVVAQKNDKDLTPMLDHIVPLFDHIIATEGVFEPKPAATLARRIRQKHDSVEAITDATAATKAGLKRVGNDGGLLVTGSLYMIPAALKLFAQ